eukprot:gene15978-19000_t
MNGTRQSISALLLTIVLCAGQLMTSSAADVVHYSIFGITWKDLNGNGEFELGDAYLPGINVELIHNNTVIATMVSSGSITFASYEFNNIAIEGNIYCIRMTSSDTTLVPTSLSSLYSHIDQDGLKCFTIAQYIQVNAVNQRGSWQASFLFDLNFLRGAKVRALEASSLRAGPVRGTELDNLISTIVDIVDLLAHY